MLNDIFRKSAVFSEQLLQVKLKSGADIFAGERAVKTREFLYRLAGAIDEGFLHFRVNKPSKAHTIGNPDIRHFLFQFADAVAGRANFYDKIGHKGGELFALGGRDGGYFFIRCPCAVGGTDGTVGKFEACGGAESLTFLMLLPPDKQVAMHIAFGDSAVVVNRRHDDEFSGFVHFDAEFGVLGAKLHELSVCQTAARFEFRLSADEPSVLDSDRLVRMYVAHDGRILNKLTQKFPASA